MKKKIVSITPVSILKDSRTLKQVYSLDRAGYDSWVLSEGQLIHASEITSLSTTPTTQATALTNGNSLFWPILLGIKAVKFFNKWIFRTFKHLPKADLYILHGNLQFIPVWIRSRLSSAEFIYDIHDFYPDIQRNDKSLLGRAVQKIMDYLEYQTTRKACDVWTVSTGLVKLIENAYSVQSRIFRNCHDYRLDNQAIYDLKSSLNLPKETKLIALIGNCKDGQDMESFLTGLSQTSADIHTILIGGGYEIWQSEIAKRKLTSRVHLLGRVKPFDIVPLARQCDAAAIIYFPKHSNYENALPNGFFQSIAAGLPLLAPEQLPEIAKAVTENQLGILVNPHNPDQIQDAINNLCLDDNNQSFRKNAKKAAPLFTWEYEEKGFLSRVSDILESQK